MTSSKPEKKFSIVPDKKLSEVRVWFEEHFKICDRRDYLRRSPFVMLFGPTGCGKTTTLERIASELNLTIKEYSETTDTSLIQFELRDITLESNHNATLRIDKRKSLIFESFVINSVRYETLYADQPCSALDHDDDAAAEFDDDDDFVIPFPKPKPKTPTGVIIHIESPLTFGKTTPVLIQCLRRLKKIIKEISRQTPRRVAIAFEAVDGNDPIMALSSSVRQSLDIQIFKFNPVTRLTMKKFVEFELRKYNYLSPAKNTLEQLIDDCDGDANACKNTLRLLCRQIHSSNSRDSIGTLVQTNKKQKIDHHGQKEKNFFIPPKLMRDISKGSGFFHILGKIFYQKRYYPADNLSINKSESGKLREIDRPYEAENSTEWLVDQVDSEPRKLTAWLHQNYSRFCGPTDIEKAALFLDNLSFVDTISLDSTQSTQYYENHNLIDLMQKHLAIESTVFSLYKDMLRAKKQGEKKVSKDGHDMILRASVDTSIAPRTDNCYQGFAKPTSLTVSRLTEDHQALLERFSSKMTQLFGTPYKQNDLLLDYATYMKILFDRSVSIREPTSNWIKSSGDHEHLRTIVGEIQKVEDPTGVDFERRHETLLELIDQCDSQRVKYESGDATMSDNHMYD